MGLECKYLGLPMFIGRSKKRAFEDVKRNFYPKWLVEKCIHCHKRVELR